MLGLERAEAEAEYVEGSLEGGEPTQYLHEVSPGVYTISLNPDPAAPPPLRLSLL